MSHGKHVLVGGSHRREVEDEDGNLRMEVYEKGDEFVPTDADLEAAGDKLRPVGAATPAETAAADELLDLTIEELEEALADVDDLSRLAAVRENETRKGALEALNSRIVELASGE